MAIIAGTLARSRFGGTDDDRVEAVWGFGRQRVLTLAGVRQVLLFDAEVGGSQVTDISADALGSVPLAEVTSDADGYIPAFYGPEGVVSLWAQAEGGDRRFLMVSSDAANVTQAAADANAAAAEAQVAAASVQRDVPGGVAPLDEDKRVPDANLPNYVRVAEAPLNPRRYGAKNDGVTDDSAAYQAAVNALAGTTSAGGGTILVDGQTVWNTQVLVSTRAGVRFAGLGGYTSYIMPGPAVTGALLKYAIPNMIIRGVRLDDLAFDMLNVNAHAIELQGAFDNCQLANVWVRGIHKDRSGYRFLPAPGAVTDISQSILVDNCQAIRNTGTTGATAPLWELQNVHEAHFRGCKGIGAGAGDSGTAYLVHGHSQLVKFDTCSASNTDVGWDVRADSTVDYVERIVLDTPLFETINTGLKIVGSSTQKVYRVALRTARVLTPMTYLVDATYSVRGTFETDDKPVILRTGTSQSRIFSDQVSQVTDSSGDVGNMVVGSPNAGDYSYRLGANMAVDTLTTPATSTSLEIGVNATASAGFPARSRVIVGAPDSGGAGYRILRVSN